MIGKNATLFAQKEETPLCLKKQNLFDYYFFEAQKQKDLKQFDAQFDALKICLHIDSLNAAANSEIGFLYAQMQMIDSAEKSLRRAAIQQPKNWWYRSQYIKFLIIINKYEQAIIEAEKTKKIFKQKNEIYNILASLYSRTKRYKKAIKVLNQLEVYTGITKEISINKSQHYLKLGKKRKAIKEIKKLIKEYPNNQKYPIFLARLYIELGEKEKGLNLYTKILQADPDNPHIYISLAEYYKRENQPEKELLFVKKALTNSHLTADTKIKLLVEYAEKILDEEKTNETEALFKQLINTYPLEEMPYAFYSIFLQKQKRNDEALKTLESLLHINPNNKTAWKTSLKIISEKQDTTAIRKLTNKAIKANVKIPDFYFYHSISLIQKKKYKEALSNNQKYLHFTETKDDNIAKSIFHSLNGDIYYSLDQKEKAFENYELALKENPMNVLAMNNYAYYLSLEKMDLTKAERLSAETVRLEPTNSTYLDTYAYILFQKENYTLAKFYIEKAVENMSEEQKSATIYLHCGEIYWAVGEKKKALKMWEKGLELEGENKELKQKIKQHKKEYENDEN